MESRSQSITELYRMVEQEKLNAEAGSREKAEFLANMSHEMRTPMIAVCGMSELLLQNDLTPLEEEYVATIQNSAHNLLSMVNDILDFSKIEANKMNLDEAPLENRSRFFILGKGYLVFYLIGSAKPRFSSQCVAAMGAALDPRGGPDSALSLVDS